MNFNIYKGSVTTLSKIWKDKVEWLISSLCCHRAAL